MFFSCFSIILAKNNVFSFAQSDFYQKRGCVTIYNYAGACKGICSSNIVYKYLIQLFAIPKFSFCSSLIKMRVHTLLYMETLKTHSVEVISSVALVSPIKIMYIKKFTFHLFRSNPPEVFLGKSVLEICSKFTGEHPCRSAISTKLLKSQIGTGVLL